jgi:hypothetical protein
LGFRRPRPGIEELFGQDAVVSLDFAVVAWRVGRDALVPSTEEGPGEALGSIAGAVVCHDPFDACDPVGGQPGAGPMEEGDGGDGLLVRQCFGVGETAVSVYGRVQIDVATALSLLPPVDGFGLVTAASVCAPASAVRDAAHLLHVDVDHVAGPSGMDLPRLAIGFTIGVDEPAPVDADLSQVPVHGPSTDGRSGLGQLEGDPGSGPLVGPAQLFYEYEDLGRCRGRLVVRRGRAVLQPEFAVAPIAIYPLRCARPGHPHLGCDVRNRPRPATLDQSTAPLDGEGRVPVRHAVGPGAEGRLVMSRREMASATSSRAVRRRAPYASCGRLGACSLAALMCSVAASKDPSRR